MPDHLLVPDIAPYLGLAWVLFIGALSAIYRTKKGKPVLFWTVSLKVSGTACDVNGLRTVERCQVSQPHNVEWTGLLGRQSWHFLANPREGGRAFQYPERQLRVVRRFRRSCCDDRLDQPELGMTRG